MRPPENNEVSLRQYMEMRHNELEKRLDLEIASLKQEINLLRTVVQREREAFANLQGRAIALAGAGAAVAGIIVAIAVHALGY